MYKKFVLTAAAAAAIVGAGGTALAVTGDSSSASTAASGTTSAKQHQHKAKGKGLRIALRRLEHAQIVTKGKDGPVTRDLIHGSVTAVSGTSIAVKAADGTSMTFTVTKDTAVRARSKGHKPATSSISKVATGDQVFVTGVGASSPTAKHVLDLGKK